MSKILLVEDDKSLREIYGVRLSAEGYEIVAAGDGEEALAIAVKERPDLIISDVMMPKISGFDMLDILRATPETKDLKVIMMTALSSDDQRQRGESLGADRYLVKSQVGIEDVVRTVHEVLGDTPGAKTASDPMFSNVQTPVERSESSVPLGVASAPEVSTAPVESKPLTTPVESDVVAPSPIEPPAVAEMAAVPSAPELASAEVPAQPILESVPVAPEPAPMPEPAPAPAQPEPVAEPIPAPAPIPAPVSTTEATNPTVVEPTVVSPEEPFARVSTLPPEPIQTPDPIPPTAPTPTSTAVVEPTVVPPAQPSPVATPVQDTVNSGGFPAPTAPFTSDVPESLKNQLINTVTQETVPSAPDLTTATDTMSPPPVEQAPAPEQAMQAQPAESQSTSEEQQPINPIDVPFQPPQPLGQQETPDYSELINQELNDTSTLPPEQPAQ